MAGFIGLCLATYGDEARQNPAFPLPPGLPVVGKIEEAGFLEGGDFFPCGTDLAMLGIGLRSNMEACQQLMDKDLLGTARFAVVRDDFDRNQVWNSVERCGVVWRVDAFCY